MTYNINIFALFVCFFIGLVEKPLKPIPTAKPKVTRINSAGSDTDSMLARNTVITSNKTANRHTMHSTERVELFSTDSEMDSFFKENETIVNKNAKYNTNNSNNDLFSSSTSPNKTDENTMNEDLEDGEFDRLFSDAQRYAC